MCKYKPDILDHLQFLQVRVFNGAIAEIQLDCAVLDACVLLKDCLVLNVIDVLKSG